MSKETGIRVGSNPAEPTQNSLRVLACHPLQAHLVLGTKVNSNRSESDAGVLIVEQVFGIVKRDCPEQSGGGSARIGVQGKGAAAPLPLLPRFRRKDSWAVPLHVCV